MKIGVQTWGSEGDIRPFIAICAELASLGHEVRLVITSILGKDYSGYSYYWWRWWYADKDIRDNRVSFFATYLWGDTYEFSYILHAQIPGKYNVIPATGMLMYYPEVRGSSEELRLEIED